MVKKKYVYLVTSIGSIMDYDYENINGVFDNEEQANDLKEKITKKYISIQEKAPWYPDNNSDIVSNKYKILPEVEFVKWFSEVNKTYNDYVSENMDGMAYQNTVVKKIKINKTLVE